MVSDHPTTSVFRSLTPRHDSRRDDVLRITRPSRTPLVLLVAAYLLLGHTFCIRPFRRTVRIIADVHVLRTSGDTSEFELRLRRRILLDVRPGDPATLSVGSALPAKVETLRISAHGRVVRSVTVRAPARVAVFYHQSGHGEVEIVGRGALLSRVLID